MTTTPPRDQVESALAELIRQALERRESAHVPGLGTFEVHHTESKVKKAIGRPPVMLPPRDRIVFNPSR